MTFDEMFYLQTQGIAMATIFAPTYATLLIAFHEIELYAIIRNKFTLPVSNYFEQNWKRFLDEGFIFLRLSLIKPNELLDVLNNISPAIQFTMETSDSQLPYLDVMISKERKISLYGYLFKTNGLKKICLLQIKPPQALLQKISHLLLLVEFA